MKEQRFAKQMNIQEQKELERKAQRMATVKREALSLKLYDDNLGWVDVDSGNRKEEEKAMKEYIKEAYDRIPLVLHSTTGSPVILNRNLLKFYNDIMDIDAQGLDKEEKEYIEKQVNFFRQREGLVDDDGFVVIGYLNNGSPLQFAKDLLGDLVELRLAKQLRRSPTLLLLASS